MPPKFIYFDLGNVLLFFDYQVACRQMATVAGTTPEVVWKTVFEGDLEQRYESGELDDQQFYEAFCRETDTRGDFEQLRAAGSAIFQQNHSLIPIVAHLDAARYPLGILSNTCPAHWEYCSSGRFGLINKAFSVRVLSYEEGVCKPDRRIFEIAARKAGVKPNEIFYVDDLPQHVAAAREVGFDAVQYTTTPALLEALLARGVRMNY